MGVIFLLDTHAFLWLLGEPSKVPAGLVAELAHRDNRLLVSSASAMEVSTKVRIGQLPTAAALADPSVWEIGRAHV
jgi:PIN domain nuclease of toxin-antitoxin system